MQTIILGSGCFWCSEAIFQKIPNIKVTSGYSGGTTINPIYKEICSGKTGHAEVIKITYDKNKTPLNYLLEVFFKSHDPTTLNYQGNDHGTQYRSIILYETEEQKKIVEEFIKKIQKNFKDKIVTEVKKLEKFYPAESYHQDFYKNNKNNPYCRFVILPKLEKIQL